jgi:uncharacterized protein
MARRWKIVWAALAVLAIVSAIEELRYYRYGLAQLHPARRPIEAEERKRAGRFSEEVTFQTSDGLSLRGNFAAPRNGAVVVMVHGLGQNRMHFLAVAEMLARHGYGALFYDSRAHGDSDGDLATWGVAEQRDVEAAVAFASARADKVVTLGFSVGTTAVFFEATHDPRVRAVILEAIWPDIDDEMTSKAGGRGAFSRYPAVLAMKRSIDFSRVRPVDHAAELGARPKLFIAGSNDDDTPPAVMQRVVDASPDPKRFWIVPGAKHGEYAATAPVEYERVVIDFLDQSLR